MRSGSLPHARGGVSRAARLATWSARSSPRPWGCFCGRDRRANLHAVFPTPVGVFPRRAPSPPLRRRLPHARGGVSMDAGIGHGIPLSSPRPWGCFRLRVRLRRPDRVFPTPVGVFLRGAFFVFQWLGLPHARGGVSGAQRGHGAAIVSSPRPWGCFRALSAPRPAAPVFPTPVGVFPFAAWIAWQEAGLPHARGGVSATCGGCGGLQSSSPRPWGCFCWAVRGAKVGLVFPTPVGVFLDTVQTSAANKGLPHARGGVSDPSEGTGSVD